MTDVDDHSKQKPTRDVPGEARSVRPSPDRRRMADGRPVVPAPDPAPSHRKVFRLFERSQGCW